VTNDPYKCCSKIHGKHGDAQILHTKCGDVTEEDESSQRIETPFNSELVWLKLTFFFKYLKIRRRSGR